MALDTTVCLLVPLIASVLRAEHLYYLGQMTFWILWFLMDTSPEEPAWQEAGLGLPSGT